MTFSLYLIQYLKANSSQLKASLCFRHRERQNPARARAFQYACGFKKSRAGSDHIVHENNVSSRDGARIRDGEAPLHVFSARFNPFYFALRFGMARARERVRSDGEGEPAGDAFCDEERLVESALPLAPCGKRQRYDHGAGEDSSPLREAAPPAPPGARPPRRRPLPG